jgi:hypothetical protein
MKKPKSRPARVTRQAAQAPAKSQPASPAQHLADTKPVLSQKLSDLA